MDFLGIESLRCKYHNANLLKYTTVGLIIFYSTINPPHGKSVRDFLEYFGIIHVIPKEITTSGRIKYYKTRVLMTTI